MLPDEYCQQKAAASGSSFYVSFRFLPADRRKAITALYAFCREVDDIVDDQTMDAAQARFKLDGWRKEIAEMECEEVRTIQNDAKAAREDLTALIFGLDGILVRILRE